MQRLHGKANRLPRNLRKVQGICRRERATETTETARHDERHLVACQEQQAREELEVVKR